MIGRTSEARLVSALVTIALLFVASWALGYLVGGANEAAPHWFYLPVLVAAVRFGFPGAALAALLATVLAGPLLPADVESSATQHTVDWVSRGLGFILVGLSTAVIGSLGLGSIQRERRALRLEREVRRGLQNGEFVLHYQPIVAIESGEVVAAEALIRWQHPTRGLLFPDSFLAEVEHVSSVASWVLAEASHQMASWSDSLPRELDYVSVNISSGNLADFDFVHQVVNAIRAATLDPHQLCIEVTERNLIEDLDLASARLGVLRSVGVRVAVDDFGTGHASLQYLQELPVDIVKIDRTFVSGPRAGKRDHAIISSVCDLARRLGATCVAEGVETTDQLRAIRRAGFDGHVQGFLFSRAVPPEEFAALCGRPLPLDQENVEGK